MKNNKTFVVSCMILILGVVMLLGSSYSMIVNGTVTEEEYSFNVAEFDVEFLDNKSISLSGLPTSDEEGLKKSKEFTFTVSNNSNFDVNYRLDMIENSPFAMSDVIKYSYSINNSEYSKVFLLSDDHTIVQNKVLAKNSKDNYKVKLWIALDADERYMNKKFSASISLFATHNENKYATDVLEYLNKNNQDGVVSDNQNLRYLGDDSHNYVWFNCDKNYTKGNDYCEKWRIIGSFNDEYKTLKLIGNYVDSISFENEELKGNYDKSYINTYLNGAYYDKLSEETKNLIIKGKWNIGSTQANNYNLAYNQESMVKTDAYIGLPSVSDYLFIQNNNWLKYDKDITLINKNDKNVNILSSSGLKTIDPKKEVGIVPCVYLRPDVSIISGDGSINNPYELIIKYPMSYGK